MTEATGTTSRRTVAKGLAWSVPVVAVAGAAHASAASGACAGTICFGGAGIHKCCDSGDKYYWADITFTNGGNVATNVTFSFTLVTSANGSLNFAGGGSVPANSSRTFRVTSDLAGNCSQGTYAPFVIRFNDGLGNTGEAPVPGGSTGGSECPPSLARRSAPQEDTESAPEPSASTEPAPEPSGSTESAPEPSASTESAPEPSASTEPAPEPSASS